MYDLKKIGQQLKEERIKQNMSIKQLSLLSGVNCITIHGYETGQADITLKALIRIAFVLEIDINELFPYVKPYDEASEHFEYLVRNLDIRSINFMLNMVVAMVSYNKKSCNELVFDKPLRSVNE